MPDEGPRIIRRQAFVLFDDSFELGSGKEWHSNPIALKQGDDLSITATSTLRFYAGFFDRTNYDRMRRDGQGSFPFPFGKDETHFDQTYRVPVSMDYVIVLRRGVFTATGPVQLRIVRTLASEA